MYYIADGAIIILVLLLIAPHTVRHFLFIFFSLDMEREVVPLPPSSVVKM